ncbi:MAG: GNAT family N-acetyltransferase [Clostridium sp.]
MNNYTFEAITKNDINDLVEIYNSNIDFLEKHLGVKSISKEFIIDEIKEMQSVGFESKVIKDNKGNVIGLCDFKLDEECYLSLLMIKAKEKRSGLGTVIYSQLEQSLKLEGVKRIRIDVVWDYKENVIDFWKKQGFEECGKIELEWNRYTF